MGCRTPRFARVAVWRHISGTASVSQSPMEERYLAFCAFDDAAPRDGAPTSPALIEKEPIHHAAGT